MKRRTFSIRSIFSIMIAIFLSVVLAQAGLSMYFHIVGRLDAAKDRAETFQKTVAVLLRKQVEAAEEIVRTVTVGKAPIQDAGGSVLVIALLDGNSIQLSIKGWLPNGLELPPDILTPEWTATDLLDAYGRNLLVRVTKIRGLRVFAAISPDMRDFEEFANQTFLPVIFDSQGHILWMGGENQESPLRAHFRARGFVARRKIPDNVWTIFPSHQGSRIVVRQSSIAYGLSLSVIYPLKDLLVPAVLGALWQSSIALLSLAVIVLFWFLWRRGIYSSIAEIASLADEMRTRLSDIGGKDLQGASEALSMLASKFSTIRRTFVREIDTFVQDLYGLFHVISRQQEEIASFNEETEAMNQELEETNNQLLLRESVWERTLDISRIFVANADILSGIRVTLSAIREDIGAFGVLVSSVEDDLFRLVASSGYDNQLLNFSIRKDGIVASQSIETRQPVWVSDISTNPTAHPVHPKVRSELLIPLFQAGEEEGVLEVAFDSPMREDPFLIETLMPVAAYLGGLIHGEKMRREVKGSYGYLAEKLQFVTSIYHDETAAHISRIGEYCRLLAWAIGRDVTEQEDIALFARLHDIGKLKVPTEILSKPGPLTSEEFKVITNHPVWGAEIIGDASWLSMARNICLTHHEKWDGSGYPSGLRGDEIPWEGQVAAIADIYDALRSYRTYKPPLSHERVVGIITKGDGRVRPEHFNPELLRAFDLVEDRFPDIFLRHNDPDEVP